jgi:bifunctional DNase/RNase
VSIETVRLKARYGCDILLVMAADLVEVQVHKVVIDGGDGLPVVVLLDHDRDAGLALPVGPFEASAIIMELEGISPPRPLTHDLLAEFFRESGFSLDRVELLGAGEGGPRARLRYRRGLSSRTREVRPSDAVALALRLKSPICAQRALLDTRAHAEEAAAAMAPDAGSYVSRSHTGTL